MKTAIISGCTGQDGSYLSEYLLNKGDYEVYGLVVGIEDMSNLKTARSHHNFHIVEGELLDQAFMSGLIGDMKPNRFFHLAGQSFVPTSWLQPVFTIDFNASTTARILEAMRRYSPLTRFQFAASSEMYGNSFNGTPFNEESPFKPCSPYAAAKVLGHHLCRVYRESYDLFACSSICFNHESERRGNEFVTQKVARAAVAIACGCQKELRLGNRYARRDWGYAPDYIRAMTMMLDHATPDDYVIATGEAYSVELLCERAFQYAGVDMGKWRNCVSFNDKSLRRPKDVECLIGDASKARRVLGWEPDVPFEKIIETMVVNAQRIHSCERA